MYREIIHNNLFVRSSKNTFAQTNTRLQCSGKHLICHTLLRVFGDLIFGLHGVNVQILSHRSFGNCKGCGYCVQNIICDWLRVFKAHSRYFCLRIKRDIIRPQRNRHDTNCNNLNKNDTMGY